MSDNKFEATFHGSSADSAIASLYVKIGGEWIEFIPKTEVELPGEGEKPDVYGIYCNGLGEDFGFYAREAEESGLLAVYRAGFAHGFKTGVKKETTDD